MTKPKTRLLPLTIGVDLSDPASVEAAAESLGTSAEMVRDTLRFAQILREKAEDNDLTSGQLLTAIMSVMAVLVKACGMQTSSVRCVCISLKAYGLPLGCPLMC